MDTMKGIVSSIKVLKFSERPLVYFNLNGVNCLIVRHSLNFLAEVENGMRIVIAGEYNNRRQFIVRKYAVVGETKIMLEFSSNRFPRKKV